MSLPLFQGGLDLFSFRLTCIVGLLSIVHGSPDIGRSMAAKHSTPASQSVHFRVSWEAAADPSGRSWFIFLLVEPEEHK